MTGRGLAVRQQVVCDGGRRARPESQRGGPTSKTILIDELYLTVRAPRGLPEAEYAALRRALDDARFQAELRRNVRALFRQYPDLARARVVLTR